MRQLNIGFIGDECLNNIITKEIEEYGHNILSFQHIDNSIPKLDVIITTLNNELKIKHIHLFSEKIILINSNKNHLSSIEELKYAGDILINYKTKERNSYLCNKIHNSEHENVMIKIKESITDIIVKLSRDEKPEKINRSHCLNKTYYDSKPEIIRSLVSILLQRLGDQMQGRCVSDLYCTSWYPHAQFSILSASEIDFNDPNIFHFFFNENGVLKQNKYVQPNVMISITPLGDGTTVEVIGSDLRFKHFTSYLDAVLNAATDPEKTPIVKQPDELARLASFNKTTHSELLSDDLITLFRHVAKQSPESVALHIHHQMINYGTIDIESDQMACWLLERMGNDATIVAISMNKSALLLIILLGILKSNKTYVLLDPQAPIVRNQGILDDIQPDLIITDQSISAGDIPCIDPADINYTRMSITGKELPVPDNDLAYVCYTSGTTGKPKGVMITRTALSNVAQNHRNFIGLKHESRVLSIASPGFDAFGWDLYGALVSGATLYLAPENLHTDVGALYQYLSKHQIGHVTITPAILELFPCQSWPGLVSMIVMGDAPPEDVVSWWASQTRLYNGYGPTEATIATSLCEYHPGVAWNCIGKPLDNYRCHILDKNHNLLPVGFEGELCIAGDGLALGYLQQPQLTDEKFIHIQLPDSQHQERIYKTGDIAKWDEDGHLIFVGRRDHQIKIRGVRIETGEVEAAIRSHPLVESVCVISRTQYSEKVLVAFVQSSSDLTVNSMRLFLDTLLHPAAIPSFFVLLSSLPLTTNGKTDRGQLENWPLENIFSNVEQPETETEMLLERIVANAVGIPHADVTQNFISLGAHSLTMSRMVALANRDLGCNLGVADIFHHNTIRHLATFIDHHMNISDTTIAISSQRRAPLSPQQNLLWYLNALNPEDCSYNLPVAVEIRGQLNLEIFEQALNFVYEKHESLRTQFCVSQGLAYQYAKPHVPISLADHCMVHDQGSDLDQLVKQLCATPFDMTQLPPVIFKLIRYNASRYILVWVKHNIITDAWTEQLIHNDIWQHYNELIEQKSPIESTSGVQTIDIVNAQIIPDLNNDIIFWQQQLNGCKALDFPLDYPRPMESNHTGECIRYPLSPDLVTALFIQAKKSGVTPFILLTAAMKYLLSQYSNQQDIVIGTAIAARDSLDLTQVTGFHVNTVPLRTILSSEETIRSLLDKVSLTCMNAYKHQHLSFDQMLHFIEHERVPNKNPLFQIMAVLQNAGDICQTALHGCTLTRIPVSSGFSMFDMTWNFNLDKDNLVIELLYSCELFHHETMDMMLKNYEQVLREFLTHEPSTPIKSITPLCDEEQHWLLQLARNKNTSSRGSILEQIETIVKNKPHHIAVSCEHMQYSYTEMWSVSDKIARVLQKIDHTSFSVGIMMEKSCRVAALILGVLKAGKNYVPIDVHYPKERILYMVENAKVKILVTDNNGRSLSSDVTQISFDTLIQDMPLSAVVPLLPDSRLAYIMYTSGSTGEPKGVMITYDNLNNFTNDFADRLILTAKDTIMSLTSISFDIFGLELFCALVSGSLVVLCPRETAMDPVKLYHFIENRQPSVIQATPTVWETIVNHLPPQTERPLTVLCGGEKLPTSLLEPLRRVASRVLQVYGPTETTIWSTCADITHDGDHNCIGTPINMTDIYIMDRNKQLVPSGAFGELYIGGAGVSPGYWNNPELTAKAFVCETIMDSEHYLYRTGDIVRFNRRGQLEYSGRNDHQVKIRGHRIELGEIDWRLSKADSVIRALSLITGEGNQARIVSYLQLDPTHHFSENSVRNMLKETLPNIMIPSGFVILDEFPLTNNNKIDTRRLPAPEINQSASEADYIPPENEVEQQIQDYWHQVLKLSQISVTDSFFSIGGNSLQIPRLLYVLEEGTGVSLTIREFIMHSQIRELAGFIQTKLLEINHAAN